MKKFLLSLAAVAIVGASALAKEYTITFSNLEKFSAVGAGENLQESPMKFDAEGFTFNLEKSASGSNKPAYYANGANLRLYPGTMTITAPTGVKIVSITGDSNKYTNGTYTASVGTLSSTTPLTWAAPEGGANEVAFTVTKGQLRLVAITITTDEGAGPEKTDAGLVFASETVNATLGEAVPANTLTKATDAAVVYTSSNVEVATVDAATGEVTLVAAGTTTIKAATEATETYEAGEATYTLTVMDKAEIVYENDGKTDASGFTFEVGEGENPWKFSSYGMTGNAFKIAGKTADAYAVSPVFDLTNRIKPISITQTFAYNYITVAQVPEYFTIAVREEGATEWTVLTAAPAPEAMNDKKWTYVDDYAIDLGAYEGKKIQIGYHYVADGTVCGGWQIKNILVKGKKSSAVSDITVEDSDAPVVYYNMQGVRVANPANGLYIRVQGKKATKVLVR